MWFLRVIVRDQGVRPGLRRLEKEMNDYRATFKASAAAVARGFGQQWGRGWRPLALSTVAQKGHSRPNERTGRFKAELLNRPLLRANRKKAVYGSRLDYAALVTLGTRTAPARLVAFWSHGLEDAVFNQVDGHVLDALDTYNRG